MLTKNNWIQTNLKNRFTDPASDFHISIRPYKFKDMSFQESADFTCLEIAKDFDNLFLALSGGMDSDFVLRCFHRNDVKIQPIIVSCCNEGENEYAYRLCDELRITPIVIKINEEEFLKFYEEHIYKKFNGVGYNSTQMLVAAKIAEEFQGCLVTGNHFIGDGDDMITDEIYLISNEWDCYSFSSSKTIDFFLYTPEIFYALMPREYVMWNIHKQKTYGIPYREKMRPNYSDETIKKLKDMSRNRIPIKKTGFVQSKKQFYDLFDKHKL